MKKENQFEGTTRRSFMKKSVVAAVAASNLIVFSGLVNASVFDYDGGFYSGTQGRLCSIFDQKCVEKQLYKGGAWVWICDCWDEVANTLVPDGAACDDQYGTNAQCR